MQAPLNADGHCRGNVRLGDMIGKPCPKCGATEDDDCLYSGNVNEITARIHTLLGQFMKDREADAILLSLRAIVVDKQDGPEFAQLIQAWVAQS